MVRERERERNRSIERLGWLAPARQLRKHLCTVLGHLHRQMFRIKTEQVSACLCLEVELITQPRPQVKLRHRPGSPCCTMVRTGTGSLTRGGTSDPRLPPWQRDHRTTNTAKQRRKLFNFTECVLR